MCVERLRMEWPAYMVLFSRSDAAKEQMLTDNHIPGEIWLRSSSSYRNKQMR